MAFEAENGDQRSLRQSRDDPHNVFCSGIFLAISGFVKKTITLR